MVTALKGLLTWNTVTMAHTKESKFERDVITFPNWFGNTNFPPNMFMPKMANVNINKNNSAKNVMTEDVVRNMTAI